MRLMRFFHSLHFKISAGIAVPLLLILSGYSYIQYVQQREILLTNLDHATIDLGDVIVGTLQHAMLRQDLTEIQDILDSVGTRPEIRDVFLMDDNNEIRFTSSHQNIGTRVTFSDPGCAACHASNLTTHPSSVVLTTAQGERVFRSCTPIENQTACQSCHGTQAKYNGVLITDVSMQQVNNSLAADLRTNILWGFGVVFTTILVVYTLMNRLVVTNLERLVEVIKRFGRGDLSQRLPVQSHDEIGELAASFNRMADGLSEKQQLEARVRERTQELERLNEELRRKETVRRQLLRKVITAQEEERKRIARDLHDRLGAALSALTMSIEAIGQTLPAQSKELQERWQHTQALAVQALEETHELLLDLRPVVLDDLGLIAAIRADAQEHLQSLGIDAQVRVSGVRRRLAPELELTLFRIVQEAINNITKHAHAQHVSIAFAFEDSVVQVTIEDDGQGFDVHAVSDSEDKTRGLGLLGMAERAELAGGSFQFESQPGHGTHLVITMPTLEKENQ